MTNYFGNKSWRGILFNKIIRELNYTSYLELGVSTGEHCFNLVECKNKVGVDANANLNIPNVVCDYTDEYFKKLDTKTKFDLIYIDASHEKYQVYNDFNNSTKHLNRGGMIILHDIYPLNEDFSSQQLNGDCYEFWIELVKNYPEETSTFIGYDGDPEGTIGIFLNSKNNFNSDNIQELKYSYDYFINNLPKYIYHKVLTEDQLILNAKTW